MPTLDELWRVRNAAALTVGLTEDQMRRAVQMASVEDIVALIETFSPARSSGTEWTRTFEPLVERLWSWCDSATMSALADVFQARGMAWRSVAHALSSENGSTARADIRHPAGARLPAFTLV